MSLYTLGFLCAFTIFALQVPGNLGQKYIYIPGIGRVLVNGRTVITRKVTGGWNPFKPVNPNNGWNPFKPVNPNNGWNPFKPVNPNNGWNPFKPVNPNNRPSPNKPSGNSGRGSPRGSGGSPRGSGGSPSSSPSTNPSEIVNKHNDLRRGVRPTASNMFKLRWSKDLAANAQQWADKCTQKHSTREMRRRKKFGENLFSSSGPTTWDKAIQSWYDEVKLWKYGQGPTQSNAMVGHYTQIVWAKSKKIGCGMAVCPNSDMKYYFVCQYSPPGNFGYSYKQYPYKKGRPCSGCRGSCDNKLCT